LGVGGERGVDLLKSGRLHLRVKQCRKPADHGQQDDRVPTL
jgi:hypothetical protein